MTASLGSPCTKIVLPFGYVTTRRAAPADSRNAWASKAACCVRGWTRRAFALAIRTTPLSHVARGRSGHSIAMRRGRLWRGGKERSHLDVLRKVARECPRGGDCFGHFVFTHLHIPEGEGRFGLNKDVAAATGDHVANGK